MRLDKYLKVSRLIKRRTVANEACDAGRVLVNGRAARASYDVKSGDELELQFGQRTVKVRVLTVADNVGKADASALYEEICPHDVKKARLVAGFFAVLSRNMFSPAIRQTSAPSNQQENENRFPTFPEWR